MGNVFLYFRHSWLSEAPVSLIDSDVKWRAWYKIYIFLHWELKKKLWCQEEARLWAHHEGWDRTESVAHHRRHIPGRGHAQSAEHTRQDSRSWEENWVIYSALNNIPSVRHTLGLADQKIREFVLRQMSFWLNVDQLVSSGCFIGGKWRRYLAESAGLSTSRGWYRRAMSLHVLASRHRPGRDRPLIRSTLTLVSLMKMDGWRALLPAHRVPKKSF